MAAEVLLEVSDLCVEYVTGGNRARAVDGVSLELARGEFLCIVGESGCGKSTLLFSIAQLLIAPAQIVSGSVLFKGTEMVGFTGSGLRAIRWRDLSVVMQSAMNALNPVKRIGAQFEDALRAHGISRRDKQYIATRGAEVLRLVGIDPVHIRSYPYQLSGGMRQRAMVAMALLFSPDLIIMDEPTSALDVIAQQSLMVRIRELQRELGFAVIFVTHDLSLASRYSDRLAVMYAGQIAELGQTRRVFDDPHHPYTRGLLDAFPSIRGPRLPLMGIPGNPPDLNRLPPGCRFAPRCPDVFERCPSERPPLYDVQATEVRCFLYDQAGARQSGRSGPTVTVIDAPVDALDPGGTAAPISAPVPADALRGVLVPASAWSRSLAEDGIPRNFGARITSGTLVGEDAVLRAVDVSRHFHIGSVWRTHQLHAVDNVTLDVGRQEIVALVGESGSGKSTLARLFAKTYRPTSGEIYFQGRGLSTLKSRADLLKYRAAVSMVFQDPYSSLNPTYRISYALYRTIALHRPELGRREAQREIERVLEAVGLSPAPQAMEKYPHELSGGQRQRVGFAQALLSRPQVILADEPVSMLDVSIRVGLLNLMMDLRRNEGVSLLYITHDIASARYVADRLIVMYAGCVVEAGPAEEVLQHPRHPYTELLVAAVPDPRVTTSISSSVVGEPPRVIDPGTGCRFRWRCPYAIDVCGSETPALRNVGSAHEAACHVTTEEGLPVNVDSSKAGSL